jgi:hypothetical protein
MLSRAVNAGHNNRPEVPAWLSGSSTVTARLVWNAISSRRPGCSRQSGWPQQARLCADPTTPPAPVASEVPGRILEIGADFDGGDEVVDEPLVIFLSTLRPVLSLDIDASVGCEFVSRSSDRNPLIPFLTQ